MKQDCHRRLASSFIMKFMRNYDHYVAVHEAGHMTVGDMLDLPSCYGYNHDEDGTFHCVRYAGTEDVKGAFDTAVTMAGDVACAIAMGLRVDMTCVALWRHADRKGSCTSDWNRLRRSMAGESEVVSVARILEMWFSEHWDRLVANYRLARIYFEMPFRLWQVMDLLDNGDDESRRKVFGGRENDPRLRGLLLDPKTCLDTMHRMGMTNEDIHK